MVKNNLLKYIIEMTSLDKIKKMDKMNLYLIFSNIFLFL